MAGRIRVVRDDDAVGMHLDARAVQRHRVDLSLHVLRLPQLLESAIEHAGPGPAAHACSDRVPIAEALGQSRDSHALSGGGLDVLSALWASLHWPGSRARRQRVRHGQSRGFTSTHASQDTKEKAPNNFRRSRLT